MQPLSFEVPTFVEPLAVLTDVWGRAEELYPGERGRIQSEPLNELGGGLVRVTLEVPSRPPFYQLCLDALTAIDVWCRRRWPFPSIYDYPIRYEAEPLGLELWSSTAALFARGFGDCEDLASDLCAQRQLEGISCRAVLRHQETNEQGEFWHIVTEHSNGHVEDPSALLGM